MEQTGHVRLKIARIVSDLFSPPVVWGALAFPLAYSAAASLEEALIWALIYVLLVCVLPALFIAVMVMTGRITDIHVRVRRQRYAPMAVTLFGTTLAWIILSRMDVPLMPEFALISLIEIAVMLTITLVWQISLHAMSITTAVVVAGAFYGSSTALILVPLIPIVGVSRVMLQRHTVPQVIAGGVIGAGMTLLLMAVIVAR
ncbi:MAG: hypothetical protein L6Q98_11555 [Anaerolineae bacterium]|nr:hypothetical protein [Anaerolineae bacterium]NUQ05359.1 hypothetical protein [Anaerolineae bacterium]